MVCLSSVLRFNTHTVVVCAHKVVVCVVGAGLSEQGVLKIVFQLCFKVI